MSSCRAAKLEALEAEVATHRARARRRSAATRLPLRCLLSLSLAPGAAGWAVSLCPQMPTRGLPVVMSSSNVATSPVGTPFPAQRPLLQLKLKLQQLLRQLYPTHLILDRLHFHSHCKNPV